MRRSLIGLLLIGAVGTTGCDASGETPTAPGAPDGATPVSISANAAPRVSAGPNVTIKLGTKHQLRASFTDANHGPAPWTYQVEFGDGARGQGIKRVEGRIPGFRTYTRTGTFTVKVKVQDKSQAKGSASYRVTVVR